MNKKRSIPAVSTLLNDAGIKKLINEYSRTATVRAIREVLAQARQADAVPAQKEIVQQVESRLQALTQVGLNRVINATGTLIHTNLGRSVLGKGVLKTISDHLSGYTDLEYDTTTGRRGKRGLPVADKIVHLTGAEAAVAVNNNAAAVLLAVNTFALGKEVIVSRGELVEIGGSFRLPDIISQAGGVLKEVGTTNKTRIADYQQAIGKNTGLILKMHTSNYRIEGFTETPDLTWVAALSKKKKIPFLYDTGSGLLTPPGDWGLLDEPEAAQAIKAGAALVSMSGDKLIGGPQAGLIAGNRRYVGAMKKNPMMRALRMGKIALAALDAALVPFVNVDRIRDIPLFKQLSAKPAQLKRRAARLAKALASANKAVKADVISVKGSTGGGTLPGRHIDSFGVAVTADKLTPQKLAAQCRSHSTPVIGTHQGGRFVLNALTLLDGDEKEIVSFFKSLK